MVDLSKNKRVLLSHNESGTRWLVDKGANTNFLLWLFVKRTFKIEVQQIIRFS